jgi:hypothetical protein
MRKVVLLAALAITGLIAIAPAAEAQTQPFSASFKGNQRLKEPPCATGVLCGSGSISGFGDATYSALPLSLGPVSGSCQALTALVFIDLSNGQGSLTLSVDGNLCYPGKSHDAPGVLHSFGNPARIDATYEVTDGTGVFEGAEGSGSATLRTAGAQNQLALSGVLDL